MWCSATCPTPVGAGTPIGRYTRDRTLPRLSLGFPSEADTSEYVSPATARGSGVPSESLAGASNPDPHAARAQWRPTSTRSSTPPPRHHPAALRASTRRAHEVVFRHHQLDQNSSPLLQPPTQQSIPNAVLTPEVSSLPWPEGLPVPQPNRIQTHRQPKSPSIFGKADGTVLVQQAEFWCNRPERGGLGAKPRLGGSGAAGHRIGVGIAASRLLQPGIRSAAAGAAAVARSVRTPTCALPTTSTSRSSSRTALRLSGSPPPGCQTGLRAPPPRFSPPVS